MTKKIAVSLLIGVLVLFAVACGNKPNENQAIPVDEKEHDKLIFNKSVFLGDSLLNGLSDVLKDSNVISNAGATAQFALNEVDKIVSEKPKNVFILLGSDDLLWPVDNPKEHSLNHYAQLIEEIKGKLPNVKVHVLSVPPVTKEAMKVEPRYKNISSYNEALEKMAVTREIDYIDLSSLFDEHQNLYLEDGIHFKENFYPLLLNYINDHIHTSKNSEGMRDEK